MLRPLQLAGFVVACAVPSLAHAQWSPDPNGNNPVAVVGDVQSFPIVVGDALSGAIFAWRSARFDPGSGTTVYDIYAQRFDGAGVRLWAPNGVLVVSGSVAAGGTPMNRPFGMATSSTGGVIVAWQDVRNAPDTGDIYAQKLNNTGIPQWGVGGVPVMTANGLQDRPLVASDGSGGAVIVWQDRRNGPANSDIYAQRLNASGLPQWFASGVPVCSAPGDQLLPEIETTQSGLRIAWADSRGGDQDIYAQELTLAGGPQWMLDGVPVSAAPGNQTRPALYSGTIAWEDDRNGGDRDIYAQLLTFAGTPQWTPNGVQVTNAPNASSPTVGVSFGNFVIAWQDERNGAANIDIFAQALSSAGVPQWTANGITVSGAAGNQVSPVSITAGTTSMMVAWEDARNGAADVFAQGIAFAGAVWTPDGVPISTASNRQGQISMVLTLFNPAGAILVWEDERSGATGTDIYAAKVSTTGVLPVTLRSFSIE